MSDYRMNRNAPEKKIAEPDGDAEPGYTTEADYSPEPEGSPELDCSVVVPLYNEAESVPLLAESLFNTLEASGMRWEVLLVDDGSLDATLMELQQARQRYGMRFRVLRLQRNYGQTMAMQAGLDHARGEVIVTLDGDLQNDPADIPRMVTELKVRDLDLLVGWRRHRKDTLLLRKLPSTLANRLIGRVTGVRLHDYGCSLKAYRAKVIHQVRIYGEMHRFIPAWVACQVPSKRIGEMEVNHHARQFGESKYGISRVPRVLLDLLSVLFFMRFRARPAHFFGSIGLGLGSIGGLMLGWLTIAKFILGEDIGQRPMLLVGIMLVLGGMQFITTGVLAEIVSRIYLESNGRPYHADELE